MSKTIATAIIVVATVSSSASAQMRSVSDFGPYWDVLEGIGISGHPTLVLQAHDKDKNEVFGVNPTFATRGPELFKWLIFRSERSQGRHHKVAGHADCGTPAAITLGRGWLGKLNCKRWSRMAWSSSGSV